MDHLLISDDTQCDDYGSYQEKKPHTSVKDYYDGCSECIAIMRYSRNVGHEG
ncbi:uncharacterized protein K460DRAFT_363387 [Cucurbitaria berberidis CBS 394.84]|uniref:Uncharacterized protein n=1 Tax=Cucurbitaria berberidis CBS 394.84 TaxID=1168544 RepID=A0A9P4GKG6_9PLEO|nr:uncharacterized protein K460DRAFT_363387 [Cucurbitaria berberidis CBS 394.84]KAF1847292.1 hypothetical protein K460DRAFT_363387 [Cucurbitaria berberidis CBS 394.84]